MTRIIPPVLTLIGGVLNLTLHFLIDNSFSFGWHTIGALLMPFGFYVFKSSVGQITSATTQIHTFKKPSKMLTNGTFGWSRNPIYLGFLLFLLGIGFLLGSWVSFTGTLLFFGVANVWYIPYEERVMTLEFGASYLDYKKRVRKWI